MFTGIITSIGRIKSVRRADSEDMLLQVLMPVVQSKEIEIGGSVAHNGVCLTAISIEKKEAEYCCSYQLSKETFEKTTAATWKEGQFLNIERALTLQDELGGHLVLGHVDGITEIRSIHKVNQSHECVFDMPQKWRKYIAPKGSITIDGVSLTVNEVNDQQDSFTVNIVEHTLQHTIFQYYRPGDKVNIEIDPLARYSVRYLEAINK